MPGKDKAITCRPARPEDTPDVLELTSRIWEGEDYVPEAWKSWLADPVGRLAVAERAGRVLGLGKLTRLLPGQWWLEGLRVHPDFEGHGIASRLHEYLLDLWEKEYEGVLRLATASFRLPIQHLCERTGFDQVGEYSIFIAPPLQELVESFHPVRIEEIESASRFVDSSPALELQFGMMDLGWEWVTPQPLALQDAARREQLLWWHAPHKGLVSLREDEDAEQGHRLQIQLLVCDPPQLTDCLLDVRRLASCKGYSKARWIAPLQPQLLPTLEKSGFERDWDASLYIYAKQHPERPFERLSSDRRMPMV